ncbi:alkaline phosphatase family protein [Bradyrhizobium sp. CB82]|uniref:alkaline phosphatase family protein n=1 Tax=Bradyrhizobium sp. CB82 TaxID=3039159 RepID=UPI0032C24B91
MLWLGEPDHIQHEAPLGSPEHLAVLAAADAHAGLVTSAVQQLRAAGDDILLLIGSDHGHQTVTGVVDIDAEFVMAGLKESDSSNDVMAVSNGTSALIYVDPDRAHALPALRSFLASRDWVGALFGPDELAQIGQKPEGGLAFGVSMAASEAANDFGVPGASLVAKPAMGKPDRLGCGQHGGLARYEQTPFLMVSGPGFQPGAVWRDVARIVDIAPTALAHLGLDATGMDGAPLQRPVASTQTEETR